MRYQRFEDLPVWNSAIETALALFRLTATGRLSNVGDLKNQIERAALSVSNNIAEGFERGTNNELISFLYIARGSSGEVRSMLHFLRRFPDMAAHQGDIDDLICQAEGISKQLGGWIESIKNSGYQGVRSQTAQTRQRAQAVKRQDDFQVKLQAIREEAARMTTSAKNEDEGHANFPDVHLES